MAVTIESRFRRKKTKIIFFILPSIMLYFYNSTQIWFAIKQKNTSIVSELSSFSEEHSLKKRTDGRSLHDIAELGKSIEKISFGENTKSPQTILMTSSLIIIVSLSLSFEPAIQS